MNHLISVIVPVYNTEKYLAQCIESILNQTYKNLEIILIDDGSKDNSSLICDEYQKKDYRVKVIHQNNFGVAVARNRGLDIANGEYIAFVDSDDYIENEMYQKMLEVAINYKCDLVLCDCLKEYKFCSKIYSHNIKAGFYNYDQLVNEYYHHLLIMENIEYPATISNWTFLFKKEIMNISGEKIRYEPGIRYSEDWLFGSQIAYSSKSLYYMKGEVFYHYRMNDESASHKFISNKWNDYERLYNKMSERFLNVKEYDFTMQLNLVQLFLVYNAIGDILQNDDMLFYEKKKNILLILQNNNVKKMFKKIKISNLYISNKQKTITFFYKYNICIGILIKYMFYKKLILNLFKERFKVN